MRDTIDKIINAWPEGGRKVMDFKEVNDFIGQHLPARSQMHDVPRIYNEMIAQRFMEVPYQVGTGTPRHVLSQFSIELHERMNKGTKKVSTEPTKIPTVESLAKLALKVLDAQQLYFKERSRDQLKISKALEGELRKACEATLFTPAQATMEGIS